MVSHLQGPLLHTLYLSKLVHFHSYNSYATSPDQPSGLILIFTAVSDSQLSLHTAFDSTATLIVIQSRLDPLFDKLLHLLWCPPNETLRVKEGVKAFFDRVEVRIGLDALDEVVLQAELLDLVGSLMRQDLQIKFTPSVSRHFLTGSKHAIP